MYLILGMILFGMVIGAGAQFILGRDHGKVNWSMAIVAGIVGSFIGGLVVSLLSGDGLNLRPSWIIGSLAGAVVVTAVWRWMESRKAPAKNPNRRSGNPAKRNQSPKH
jgi:uncharacterized membrane protein YeaQ/YmgE (transglycosylase-associated protein family)